MRAALTRRGETVLVTGATGYVGSVVAEKLQSVGYTVRGLTRSEGEMPRLEAGGIEPVFGDVRDAGTLGKAATGAKAIVHTASPNAPAPGQSMEQMIADAVRAADQLADIATGNDARFIVTSGVSIYGPTAGKIVDETAPLQTMPQVAPLGRLETELAEKGRACILRLGVVYGRDQSAPMRMLVEAIRTRNAPVIVDPTNRLSVVHVDDLADLYLALLEAEEPPRIVNGVTSILPWLAVMDGIAGAAGVSGEPEIITPEEAMTLGGPAIFMPIDMAVSGERARRRLGWQPKGPGFESDLTKHR